MKSLIGAMCLTFAGCQQHEPAREGAQARQPLALLTSLPIVFGETFTLDTPTSSLLAALEKEFTVRPVDGPEMLPKGGLLLAIQPQALTAERLVALDAWIRNGGRMVLLADPQLEWNSERPLGDRFRPPYVFPDTGLLANWGLRLRGPAQPGPSTRSVGEAKAATVSSGAIESFGRSCIVIPDGFAAVCRLGKGSVTIYADADWVMPGAGSVGEEQAATAYPLLLEVLASY